MIYTIHVKRIKLLSVFFLFSFTYSNAQLTTIEERSDLLYKLKEYVRDWSCVPLLEGTFKDKIEFSLESNYLIIKKNYTEKDAKYFNFPEYSKTFINLLMVRSFSFQNNDKPCAAINIYTKPEGIRIVFKYRESDIEIPYPKEEEFRIRNGWINDEIRINKTGSFLDRSERIIEVLKKLARLSGNINVQ